jgi:transcriptional regulator with GAF, ATPase, and Fis domain/TolA-binding protein
MSNARDDKDWLQPDRNKKHSGSVFSPTEEIGQMHFATENYSTAIEYFQKTLESQDIKDYPDRFRLNLRIGDCYRKKGSYREARQFLERARAFLGDSVPGEAIGKIEFREAYILVAQGNYDDALKCGFRAYRRLKHSSEHRDVADIQLLLADCYHRLGLIAQAEEFFMDALSSYRRIEDRVGIAYVYNNLGLLHKNSCRWNRAIASLSKSRDIAKNLGLTQHLIRVELNLGVVYAKLRRFTDALSAFSAASTMAERFGDQDKLTKATLMHGRTLVQCGEHCKAEKYILTGQAMASEFGYGRECILADEFLGELMIARGKYEEALLNLQNALQKAKKMAPEGDITAEILRRVADVQFKLNRVDEAQALIDEGLEISQGCAEHYEIGFFHRTNALCWMKKGRFSEAVQSMKTSVEVFEKYGNPYEKALSEQLLGRLHLRSGDHESLLKAKQVLGDSIVELSKLDEPRHQILSHVVLAVVDQRLGNLDDALLSIYEADRIAEDEQVAKYRKVLQSMRADVESRMASATTRVLDQFSVFGDIQSGSRSRDKLVAGLTSTLKLIVENLGAQSGLVAIPGGNDEKLNVACRENLSGSDAQSFLSWYDLRHRSEGDHGIIITGLDREAGLTDLSETLSAEIGTLVVQRLGFENEDLGVIVIHQEKGAEINPLGQEALHFVAAYSRLISISVYELIRNERRSKFKPKPARGEFESIVTDNNEMIKLLNLAERVAHSDATVLLQGETGTGKGLIAYAVHLLSERREKRFVHVNCAAMPESLLESELFGHVKGSFTGAISDKAGLLRQAHGGTVFLDEIGKTTLAMQGKLLQFLDTGKVRKVGSNELLPVDVRVICASKADLMLLCNEGRFLEDFFYRINDFPLTVPPLRHRREDIPLLLFHYLRKYSREMNTVVTDVTDDALARLKSYDWPGNVRELEKVVKRAVILADDNEPLDLRHLPPELVHDPTEGEGRRDKTQTLRDRIAILEKREILAALDRHGWNKSQASIELGISYPNLLAKIKRYHLQ